MNKYKDNPNLDKFYKRCRFSSQDSLEDYYCCNDISGQCTNVVSCEEDDICSDCSHFFSCDDNENICNENICNDDIETYSLI